jgi:hypothetical protein
MGKWTDAAVRQRMIIDTAVGYLSDEQALTVKSAYRTWENLVRNNAQVPKGTRFIYGDSLFKTAQAEYTFVSHYVPGSIGTESLFTRIDESHSGTETDPIPYDGNMELEEGKYYSQNGAIYLCNRSTGTPVYHALSDLVGIYVELIS